MKILVTGGLGYIGSHTVVELQQAGYEVIIIDNLSNSSATVLEGISAITGVVPVYENLDLRKKSNASKFFKKHADIAGVIHFAAFKAVGESAEYPLRYYENNIHSLVYLLQELLKNEIYPFIFSSSCSVYGDVGDSPVTEDTPLRKPASPYGNTKQIGESIVRDVVKANPAFKAISLRYFNPIGAHPSGIIGETPKDVPKNLAPLLAQAAAGKRDRLPIFGTDYPTRDGTCVRDYLHVCDVARAHTLALKRLLENRHATRYEVFNIGAGEGTTVLEIIHRFEAISGKKIPYEITGRRPGDVAIAYADISKAKNILGWTPQYTLDEALRSAWRWEQALQHKTVTHSPKLS